MSAKPPFEPSRVLLLNPPASRQYIRDNYCSMSAKGGYAWPPIDLLTLSGQLAAKGHAVTVLDANVLQLDAEQARARIRQANPEVLVAVTGTVSWPEDLPFFRSIARPGLRCFLSGGFLLRDAERVLAREAWLEGVLLSYAASGLDRYLLSPSEGPFALVVRTGDAVQVHRTRVPNRFAHPPGLHREFPLDRYALPTSRRAPVTAVVASVGCPFRCSFCISSIIDPALRDPDNVVLELQTAKAAGAREIVFLDQTFTASEGSTLALCEKIERAQLDLTWSCQTHTSRVTAPVLAAMKRAGCHTVHFGVESASQAVLDRHEKRSQLDGVREAFRMTRAAGLRTLGYFVIGLPGETVESTRQTIDFALELDPDFASFSFASPEIGTALGDEVEARGWHTRPDQWDSSADAMLSTPELTDKQARDLMAEAVQRFYLRPRYMARLLVDMRSPFEITNLARSGSMVLSATLRRRFREATGR